MPFARLEGRSGIVTRRRWSDSAFGGVNGRYLMVGPFARALDAKARE